MPHPHRRGRGNGCRRAVPRGRLASLRVERFIEPLIPPPLCRVEPASPELALFAEVVADAVNLVRGVRVSLDRRILIGDVT